MIKCIIFVIFQIEHVKIVLFHKIYPEKIN